MKRKKKSLSSKIVSALLLPIAICGALFTAYWCNDEFWLYAQLNLLNQDQTDYGNVRDRNRKVIVNEDGEEIEVDEEGNPIEEDDNLSNGVGSGTTANQGGSSQNSSQGLGGGRGGINIALINSMSNGFFKDYLSIIASHTTWENMQIARINAGGGPMNFDVRDVLGSSMVETGTTIISTTSGSNPIKATVPYTYLKINESYGKSISKDGHTAEYNLYTADSTWFRTFGLDNAQIGNGGGNKETVQFGEFEGYDRAKYTQFQFTSDFFKYYPSSSFVTSNVSPTGVPSKLSQGFGMEKGVLRSKEQSDAAYFPDQVAILIGSAPGRLAEAVDTDSVNPEYFGFLSWMAHNSPGTVMNAIGDTSTVSGGTRHGGIDVDKSGISRKRCASSGVNILGDAVVKCRDFIFSGNNLDKVKSLGFDFENPPCYEGMYYIALLTCKNAFFTTEAEKSSVIKSFNSKNVGSAMKKGATVAYWACTGNTEASEEDVMSYLANAPVRDMSDSSKYNLHGGSGDNALKKLYVEDSSIQVYYRGASTQVNLIHRYPWITCRGPFQIAIGGSYKYYQLLQWGGLDAAPDDTANNTIVNQMPDTNPSFENGVDAVALSDFYRGCKIVNPDGTINDAEVEKLNTALEQEVGRSRNTKFTRAQLSPSAKLCEYHKHGTGYNSCTYYECPWWVRGRSIEYFKCTGNDKGFKTYTSSSWGNGGQYLTNNNGRFGSSADPNKPKSHSNWDLTGHIAFIEAAGSDNRVVVSESGSGNWWGGVNIMPAGKYIFGNGHIGYIYLDDCLK